MTESRFLVAPPGTRIGEPGWVKPWPGLTLTWGINGEVPALAVQRDGVLLSTGLSMRPPVADHVDTGDAFWLRVAGLALE